MKTWYSKHGYEVPVDDCCLVAAPEAIEQAFAEVGVDQGLVLVF